MEPAASIGTFTEIVFFAPIGKKASAIFGRNGLVANIVRRIHNFNCLMEQHSNIEVTNRKMSTSPIFVSTGSRPCRKIPLATNMSMAGHFFFDHLFTDHF